MTETPALNEWRRLYKAASRIKEIEPWKWMTETEIFGVQDPDTREIGFVSVMGMLGEHHALSLYRGAHGLYQFWTFEEYAHVLDAQHLLEIPQLQVSFEDREMLRKEDRTVIKAAGLKFRGRGAWPLFRSYRPGYFPWLFEAHEVRTMTYALEQAAEVALRYKEDRRLLETEDETLYLVRIPRRAKRRLSWSDRVMEILPPPPPSVQIRVDAEMLETAKRLPQIAATLEMDVLMMPAPVREADTRPYYPYVLLIVDARHGLIVGNDMMAPQPSLEAMWSTLPMRVLSQMVRMECRPAEIKTTSIRLAELLQPLAEVLDVPAHYDPDLPYLEEVKTSMLQFFGGMSDDA